MKLSFTEDIYRYLQSRSEEELLEEFRNETLLNNLDILTELDIYTKLKQLNKNDEEEFKRIIKKINKNKLGKIEFISSFDNEQIIFNPNLGLIKELKIDIKYSDKKLNFETKDIVKSENIKYIKREYHKSEAGEQLESIYFEIKFPKGTPQGNYYEYIAFPKELNSKTYTFSILCDGGYTFKQYPKNLQEFGILFDKDSETALELFNNEEFKHWLRHKDKSINKIDNKLEADLYERVHHDKEKRSIDELKEYLKIIEIISLDKKENSSKSKAKTDTQTENRSRPKIKQYNIKETMGISGKIKLNKLIDTTEYKCQITNNNDIYICYIEEDGSVIIKQDISPIERSKIKIMEGIKQKSTNILHSMKLIKENKKTNNDKLSLLREDILKANQKINIRAIPNDKKECIKVYTIEILRK